MDTSEQSNPDSNRDSTSDSIPCTRPNRSTAAMLIPDWMRGRSKVRWCDSGTDEAFRSVPAAELFELVALISGIDADSLGSPAEALAFLEQCQRIAEPIPDPFFRKYSLNMELALRALDDGDICPEIYVPECKARTVVAVETFEAWAERAPINKPRMGDGAVSYSWGSYSHLLVRCVNNVMHTHYRLKAEGGTYDPLDPNTHPLPEDVKATIRRWNLGSARKEQQVYQVTRDPAIPPGRRRRPLAGG